MPRLIDFFKKYLPCVSKSIHKRYNGPLSSLPHIRPASYSTNLVMPLVTDVSVVLEVDGVCVGVLRPKQTKMMSWESNAYSNNIQRKWGFYQICPRQTEKNVVKNNSTNVAEAYALLVLPEIRQNCDSYFNSELSIEEFSLAATASSPSQLLFKILQFFVRSSTVMSIM